MRQHWQGVSDTIEPPPRSASETSLEEQLNQLAKVKPDAVGPRAFLLVAEGPQAGRLHVVGEGSTTVGRGGDADIQINDPSASQLHARIHAVPGGFELEDLDSRNGTRVNGEWIKRTLLHHKDAIVVGGTNLLFLSNTQEQAETQVIAQPSRSLPPPGRNGHPNALAVVNGHGVMAPGMAYPSHYPAVLSDQEEDGKGFADLVRSTMKLLRLVKRYAWVLFPLPLVAGLVGATSFYWLPGMQKAEATVRLQHYEKDVAQPQAWQPPPREVFFVDPILNFAQEQLVQKTLADMNVGASVDPKEVAKGLAIESTGRETYDVAFAQDMSSAVFLPETFLEAHLRNYLIAEVDKAITTFAKQAQFLEEQVQNVEKELRAVEEKQLQFKQEHVAALPDKADEVIKSQQGLSDERRRLETEVDRLRQQLANVREQLDNPRERIRVSLEDVSPLKESLSRKRDELTAARAAGKTTAHHDVVRLEQEIRELDAEIARRLNSPLSDSELRGHPRFVQLQRQADEYQGELKVAQRQLARIQGYEGSESKKIASMPEVQITLDQMEREKDRLQEMHTKLFQQHRERQKQMDLEKASVESRYQIVNPPKQVNMRDTKYLIKRVGLGVVVGLSLALLIVAILEIKLYIKRHPELTTT